MLKTANTVSRGHNVRGMRIESPDSRATSSMPSEAMVPNTANSDIARSGRVRVSTSMAPAPTNVPARPPTMKTALIQPRATVDSPYCSLRNAW